METLDSTVPKGNPNASYWPYVIRWGVIIGVIGTVLTMLIYIGGSGLSPLAWLFSLFGVALVSILLSGILATRGVREYRETDLGGLIPFGKAFLVAFLILLISSLISNVFNLLYITVINPDFVNDFSSKMGEMFANADMSEADIEEQMEKMKSSFSLNRQLLNIALAPVGAAVIGLISAAVAKRNPPME